MNLKICEKCTENCFAVGMEWVKCNACAQHSTLGCDILQHRHSWQGVCAGEKACTELQLTEEKLVPIVASFIVNY